MVDQEPNVPLYETVLTGTDFATRLGQVLTFLAETHPTPDFKVHDFVGFGPQGQISRKALTPREYASEITNQTPFGLAQIEDYRVISSNLGDDTGERVIQDLLHIRDPQPLHSQL